MQNIHLEDWKQREWGNSNFINHIFFQTEPSPFFNEPTCIDLGFVIKRKVKQVQKPSQFSFFTTQYLIRKVRQVLEQYQSLPHELYDAPHCACTHTNTDVQEHLYSLGILCLQLLVISPRLLWHLKSFSYALYAADLTCLRQKKNHILCLWQKCGGFYGDRCDDGWQEGSVGFWMKMWVCRKLQGCEGGLRGEIKKLWWIFEEQRMTSGSYFMVEVPFSLPFLSWTSPWQLITLWSCSGTTEHSGAWQCLCLQKAPSVSNTPL